MIKTVRWAFTANEVAWRKRKKNEKERGEGGGRTEGGMGETERQIPEMLLEARPHPTCSCILRVHVDHTPTLGCCLPQPSQELNTYHFLVTAFPSTHKEKTPLSRLGSSGKPLRTQEHEWTGPSEGARHHPWPWCQGSWVCPRRPHGECFSLSSLRPSRYGFPL